MLPDILIPENEQLLAYWSRPLTPPRARTPEEVAKFTELMKRAEVERAARPLIRSRESVVNPYYNLGSHPDVVERVWDILGKDLGEDCRYVVLGTPGLVHPRSRIVFAMCMGTAYILRLPPGLLPVATTAGLKDETKWGDGRVTNAQKEIGEEWLFGRFLKDEKDWCRAAYEYFGSRAAAH